ncbi:hypothetical protein [Streptosporangium sp. NPDC023615]|uniref:hypothetical protein n=1 Tax=Streptosporangium sp. NPDC023615 TaxID=3154794 RepID=UPI003443C35F
MSKQTAFVLMLLLAFSVIVPGSAGYLSVKMEAIGQAHRDLLSLESRFHRERLAARIKRVERAQRHRRLQPVASADREPCRSARDSGSGRKGTGGAGRRPPIPSSVVSAQAGPDADRPYDAWIRRRWFHSRWQDARRQDERRRQAEDRWARWQARDLREHEPAARPYAATEAAGAAGPGEHEGTDGTDGVTGTGGEASVWDPYRVRPEPRARADGRTDGHTEGLIGDREAGRTSGEEIPRETVWKIGGQDGREIGRRMGRQPGPLVPGSEPSGGSPSGQGGELLTEASPPASPRLDRARTDDSGLSRSGPRPN